MLDWQINYTFFSYQKLQIQEKAAQEVKLAIKPFYQNKDITKEEYKEIVRKAVDKVSAATAWVLYMGTSGLSVGFS